MTFVQGLFSFWLRHSLKSGPETLAPGTLGPGTRDPDTRDSGTWVLGLETRDPGTLGYGTLELGAGAWNLRPCHPES